MNTTTETRIDAGFVARHFGDMDQLAAARAESVAEDLRNAITTRGSASLIVPGGRTPGPFLERLSAQDVPWNKTRIGLTDERWVPTSSPKSNEFHVRKNLLRGAAGNAEFVGLKADLARPKAAEDVCTHRLGRLPSPRDIVVLGMGSDGHIASLFPGATALASHLDPDGPARCVAVSAPVAPFARMSQTLSALISCRRLVVLICGQEKRRAVEQATGDSPGSALPIGAVLRQQRVPVEVYWAP